MYLKLIIATISKFTFRHELLLTINIPKKQLVKMSHPPYSNYSGNYYNNKKTQGIMFSKQLLFLLYTQPSGIIYIYTTQYNHIVSW